MIKNKSHKTEKQIWPTISLIIVAIVWGSGFIASQFALEAGLSPEAIMFGRFSIAAIVMAVVNLKVIKEQFKLKYLKGGIILGILIFLAFFTQTIGLQYTTPSNNAFITAANVVFVPFLWWAITKVKPTKLTLLSSVICLIGVGILSLNFKDGFSFQIGDLLSLVCAFFFACQIVATGIFAKQMDFRILVFLQFATATILSLIVMLITGSSFVAFLNTKAILSVAYLGVFSTSLCYFLQTSAQRYVASSKASIYLSTEALFGSLFSVLLGYNKFSKTMFIGGALILLAVILPEIEQMLANKKQISKNL